jgi:hypothetical protein
VKKSLFFSVTWSAGKPETTFLRTNRDGSNACDARANYVFRETATGGVLDENEKTFRKDTYYVKTQNKGIITFGNLISVYLCQLKAA